jgi:ABC-type transporter Mla subunit MlaD
MEKVITLPEPLLQQASETARQKGIEVDALVIEAVEHYLEEQRGDRLSEAGRKLRELTKRMKPSENFFDGLAEARQQAYDTIMANQEWFSLTADETTDQESLE